MEMTEKIAGFLMVSGETLTAVQYSRKSNRMLYYAALSLMHDIWLETPLYCITQQQIKTTNLNNSASLKSKSETDKVTNQGSRLGLTKKSMVKNFVTWCL
jgi:hypothetical protein